MYTLSVYLTLSITVWQIPNAVDTVVCAPNIYIYFFMLEFFNETLKFSTDLRKYVKFYEKLFSRNRFILCEQIDATNVIVAFAGGNSGLLMFTIVVATVVYICCSTRWQKIRGYGVSGLLADWSFGAVFRSIVTNGYSIKTYFHCKWEKYTGRYGVSKNKWRYLNLIVCADLVARGPSVILHNVTVVMVFSDEILSFIL
jgi:hypothetical protein